MTEGHDKAVWLQPSVKRPEPGRAILVKILHRNIPVYRYSGQDGVWGSCSLSDDDVECWIYAPEI